MKKIIAILAILFIITIFSVYCLILNIKKTNRKIQMENKQYEYYLNKTIEGTELVTIINKAIDQNENNNIQKNETRHYIENEENSLKIQIKMKITEKTYQMEEFYNNDVTEFVKYFNTAKFKCIKIEYHEKTGKISKIDFEQQ